MDTTERLDNHIITRLKEAIAAADGNEVLAVGVCGSDGMIHEMSVVARGDAGQVPALYTYMEQGDVVVHNHPSGRLTPSKADLEVASKLGNQGIGFFIIDNDVSGLYIVSEPLLRQEIIALDDGKLTELFRKKALDEGAIPGFRARDEQFAMMEKVCAVFNDDEIAVIEAGTGVGKSFAYLLPAARWAVDNKERVIVSTHTINLQHQLIEKDIPVISKILGVNFKAVLAKGRSNYLCMRRLKEAVDEAPLFPEVQEDIEAIREWAEKSSTGCRSDLSFFPKPQVWQMVCSESDSCMGLRCLEREGCFVIRARKEVAGADLIVANHHLLFSDIAMRIEEIGFDTTAVLPPCRRFVYDEAHTMEESATSFFSSTLNRFSLGKPLQRLTGKRRNESGGVLGKLIREIEESEPVRRLLEPVDDVLKKFDALEARVLTHLGDRKHLLIRKGEGDKELFCRDLFENFHSSLVFLLDKLIEAHDLLPLDPEESQEMYELESIIRRIESVAEVSTTFMESSDFDSSIYWIERNYMTSGGFFISFKVTPLDVSSTMREAVFEPSKTVVCTSATLTVGGKFDHWLGKMGLEDRMEERVGTLFLGSPFPYETNALLTVPSDAPDPKSGEYIDYVVQAVDRIISVSEGRALVLFTSYSMLNTVFEAVQENCREKNISCLRQGDDDRSRLLKSFTRDISSVLFATDSFWQGVDAPGDTCKVVILCRLPFRVPTDPVVEARMEAMERSGKNPFMEMSLPEAVIRLRQGFGRLIRSHTDTGVVVILDNRIVTKRYGSLFLSSLPQTGSSFKETEQILGDIEDFLYRPIPEGSD